MVNVMSSRSVLNAKIRLANSRSAGEDDKSASCVSIVICTDNRVQSIANTLASLNQLNNSHFEVCVVCGPTRDGTTELVSGWSHPLKSAPCPERNLSMSRNIGIGLAAGDIVAFLDDDAVPEPEWLDSIIAAYEDPKVGAAGGFVYDHTGVDFQYRFGTTNRLGGANLEWRAPAPELNFPYSYSFPHLLGANSTFRKAALLEIGGFDEEYEYFLDETDVQCRLIDAGWHIRQIEGAFVHHKYMPSSLRNEKRVLQSWYPVVKNRIYYGLMNGADHTTVPQLIVDNQNFVQGLRQSLEWAIGANLLDGSLRARFDNEIDRAWADGLRRGMSGTRRLRPHEALDHPPAFRMHKRSEGSAKRETFCFLSQEYPPTAVGGVGRYIHQLARGIANLGHHVHVLTRAATNDSLDLEDGVWVHRVMPRPLKTESPSTTAGRIPDHIWAYSLTMLEVIDGIAERRDIKCVYAPVWDCEGIAILRDGRFPLVVGLQTTLKFWLMSNSHRLADAEFKHSFIDPMLSLESELLQKAKALHSISSAIGRDIAAAYDLMLTDRMRVIPLGIDDYSLMPAASSAASMGRDVDVRLLFVGRLEARKGIDLLLAALPRVLAKYPNARIDIVGNDNITDFNGSTYRAAFESKEIGSDVRRRIVFHGEVSEEALRGFYQTCDIFVAPSRFESFGLIFVEAMTYGKPVIGCRAGGMPEIIVDEETGLLAEPGDAVSLQVCLERLIGDRAFRVRLGAAGRQRYESYFTAEQMAEQVLGLLVEAGERCSPAVVRPVNT